MPAAYPASHVVVRKLSIGVFDENDNLFSCRWERFTDSFYTAFIES